LERKQSLVFEAYRFHALHPFSELNEPPNILQQSSLDFEHGRFLPETRNSDLPHVLFNRDGIALVSEVPEVGLSDFVRRFVQTGI
jgi:hypothetical protein